MSDYKMAWIKETHRTIYYLAYAYYRKQMSYGTKDIFNELNLREAFSWVDTVEGFDFWQNKDRLFTKHFELPY